MQVELHNIARHTATICIYKQWKTRLLRAKKCLKSRFLTTKSWFWGDEKLRAGHNLERLNGAKRRRSARKGCKNKMLLSKIKS